MKNPGTRSHIPLTIPSVDEAEVEAVIDVFASRWLAGQGPQSGELELGFRKLTNRSSAVAVNNCTAGLHLALAGLGLGPGDEVLVADYTFPATAHAVLYCGARPVFVDVRPDTATIDVDQLESQINPRTRGIIGVDALGMPADWKPLEDIAHANGLFLVEDAACSAGGVYRGSPCGSFGDAAVFSLHARKGITCGEGGVLTTDDEVLAETVRRRANFGMRSAYDRQGVEGFSLPSFTQLGYNYKLSDILAAIARVQLSKLDRFVARRRALAGRYGELLGRVKGVSVPQVPSDRTPTWQTYAVTLDEHLDRDVTIAALRAEGVGANIGTYALHRQEIYGVSQNPCPVSDRLFRQHLALPMYPELDGREQERVVDTLERVLEKQTN